MLLHTVTFFISLRYDAFMSAILSVNIQTLNEIFAQYYYYATKKKERPASHQLFVLPVAFKRNDKNNRRTRTIFFFLEK